MKDKFMSLLLWAKAWLAAHKRLLRNTGNIFLSVLALLSLSIFGLIAYGRWGYPRQILLENAYSDLSALELSFSDWDLDSSFEEAQAIPITLASSPDAQKVLMEETGITIRSEGVYLLQGRWEQKTLTVDAGQAAKVQLILDGFHIENSEGAAIYIRSADKVFITTREGTDNSVSDGTLCTTDGDTNIDAAIFSRADLTLNGSGTLTVHGNAAHGIVSKDDLVVASGTYAITSVKKALNGKDCVKIGSSNLSIQSGTDGICSDNTEDAGRGYVYIQSGTIQIRCNRDGIQAATAVILESPTVSVTSGGGAVNAPVKETNRGKGRQEQDASEETENTPSAKGIKSAGDILITGGHYTIDALDDGIHADHSIRLEGGNFIIQSGDDGLHAEHTLQITGGDIAVQKSFEGLEGYQIALSGGKIAVNATDDAINASSSSTANLMGFFAPGVLGKLEISGGEITVTSGGDTLDSNGVLSITGGVILAAGPAGQGDGIVDCDTGAQVEGGTLLCISRSSSGRNSSSDTLFETTGQLQLTKSVALQPAGTLLQLGNAKGTVMASFVTTQDFDKITFTAPWLQTEADATVLINGEPL